MRTKHHIICILKKNRLRKIRAHGHGMQAFCLSWYLGDKTTFFSIEQQTHTHTYKHVSYRYSISSFTFAYYVCKLCGCQWQFQLLHAVTVRWQKCLLALQPTLRRVMFFRSSSLFSSTSVSICKEFMTILCAFGCMFEKMQRNFSSNHSILHVRIHRLWQLHFLWLHIAQCHAQQH